jgi:hypothetical protein
MMRRILAGCLLLAPGLAAAQVWPDRAARIVGQGEVPMDPPAQLREFPRTGIAAWGAVIRAGNVRAE